jgi:hypothetical protein
MHNPKQQHLSNKEANDAFNKVASNIEFWINIPGAKRQQWSLNNERNNEKSVTLSGLNNRLYRSMQSPNQFEKPLPNLTNSMGNKSKLHNLDVVALSGLNKRLYRSMQSPNQFVKPLPSLSSTAPDSLTTMGKSKIHHLNVERKPVLVEIIGMHIRVPYDKNKSPEEEELNTSDDEISIGESCD